MNGLRIGVGPQESFEAWERRVEGEVERAVGCSLHDLPDVPLRDWYEAGLRASSAARKAIRSAGGAL